jgi:hypothetical protein
MHVQFVESGKTSQEFGLAPSLSDRLSGERGTVVVSHSELCFSLFDINTATGVLDREGGKLDQLYYEKSDWLTRDEVTLKLLTVTLQVRRQVLGSSDERQHHVCTDGIRSCMERVT